jgi:hypothetical protein
MRLALSTLLVDKAVYRGAERRAPAALAYALPLALAMAMPSRCRSRISPRRDQPHALTAPFRRADPGRAWRPRLRSQHLVRFHRASRNTAPDRGSLEQRINGILGLPDVKENLASRGFELASPMSPPAFMS